MTKLLIESWQVRGRVTAGRPLLLSVALAAAGCASAGGRSSSSSLSDLEARQDRIEAEISRLEVQRDALREEVAAAEKRAGAAKCQAEQWRFNASKSRVAAQQMYAVAKHAACRAQATKDGAVFSAIACIVGAAAGGIGGAAFCGGAMAISGSGNSCGPEPKLNTEEEIELAAWAAIDQRGRSVECVDASDRQRDRNQRKREEIEAGHRGGKR